MLKKTFISVLVIVIGAFMLFKAYEFYIFLCLYLWLFILFQMIQTKK